MLGFFFYNNLINLMRCGISGMRRKLNFIYSEIFIAMYRLK